MERKTAWNEYNKKDMKKLEKLNASYRAFLDNGKTERECVKESVRQAEEAGYVNLDTYVKENRALKPGDKVYAVCMKKAIALFQIGTRPLTEGMNILGAHIDSPRLDVNRTRCMRTTDLHISIPTTTAVSKMAVGNPSTCHPRCGSEKERRSR